MRTKVVIIGGGLMGCGIAATAALAGNSVTIVETSATARETLPARLDALLEELSSNELIDLAQKAQATALISCSGNLEESCAEAFFVIEAIVEKLDAKQSLFQELDRLLPADIPIASNTSGLRITDIAKLTTHPARTMTTHFWFPAHLVPLVEVVMSEYTDERLAQWTYDTLSAWGKAPVLVRKDLPGQLANRIFQAVIREASSIVEQGIASPEDVDTAVKMGMGIRFPVWGPLEHADAVGIDLCASVQDTVLPGISSAKEANSCFTGMLGRGELGFKTGKGFYDWSKKDMGALAAQRNAFIIHALKKIRSFKSSN